MHALNTLTSGNLKQQPAAEETRIQYYKFPLNTHNFTSICSMYMYVYINCNLYTLIHVLHIHDIMDTYVSEAHWGIPLITLYVQYTVIMLWVAARLCM